MSCQYDRRLNREYQVVIISKNIIELESFKNSLIKEVEVKDLKIEELNRQMLLTIKLFEEIYMPVDILRELNEYLSENNEDYCELICSYSEIKGRI